MKNKFNRENFKNMWQNKRKRQAFTIIMAFVVVISVLLTVLFACSPQKKSTRRSHIPFIVKNQNNQIIKINWEQCKIIEAKDGEGIKDVYCPDSGDVSLVIAEKTGSDKSIPLCDMDIDKPTGGIKTGEVWTKGTSKCINRGSKDGDELDDDEEYIYKNLDNLMLELGVLGTANHHSPFADGVRKSFDLSDLQKEQVSPISIAEEIQSLSNGVHPISEIFKTDLIPEDGIFAAPPAKSSVLSNTAVVKTLQDTTLQEVMLTKNMIAQAKTAVSLEYSQDGRAIIVKVNDTELNNLSWKKYVNISFSLWQSHTGMPVELLKNVHNGDKLNGINPSHTSNYYVTMTLTPKGTGDNPVHFIRYVDNTKPYLTALSVQITQKIDVKITPYSPLQGKSVSKIDINKWFNEHFHIGGSSQHPTYTMTDLVDTRVKEVYFGTGLTTKYTFGTPITFNPTDGHVPFRIVLNDGYYFGKQVGEKELRGNKNLSNSIGGLDILVTQHQLHTAINKLHESFIETGSNRYKTSESTSILGITVPDATKLANINDGEKLSVVLKPISGYTFSGITLPAGCTATANDTLTCETTFSVNKVEITSMDLSQATPAITAVGNQGLNGKGIIHEFKMTDTSLASKISLTTTPLTDLSNGGVVKITMHAKPGFKFASGQVTTFDYLLPTGANKLFVDPVVTESETSTSAEEAALKVAVHMAPDITTVSGEGKVTLSVPASANFTAKITNGENAVTHKWNFENKKDDAGVHSQVHISLTAKTGFAFAGGLTIKNITLFLDNPFYEPIDEEHIADKITLIDLINEKDGTGEYEFSIDFTGGTSSSAFPDPFAPTAPETFSSSKTSILVNYAQSTYPIHLTANTDSDGLRYIFKTSHGYSTSYTIHVTPDRLPKPPSGITNTYSKPASHVIGEQIPLVPVPGGFSQAQIDAVGTELAKMGMDKEHIGMAKDTLKETQELLKVAMGLTGDHKPMSRSRMAYIFAALSGGRAAACYQEMVIDHPAHFFELSKTDKSGDIIHISCGSGSNIHDKPVSPVSIIWPDQVTKAPANFYWWTSGYDKPTSNMMGMNEHDTDEVMSKPTPEEAFTTILDKPAPGGPNWQKPPHPFVWADAEDKKAYMKELISWLYNLYVTPVIEDVIHPTFFDFDSRDSSYPEMKAGNYPERLSGINSMLETIFTYELGLINNKYSTHAEKITNGKGRLTESTKTMIKELKAIVFPFSPTQDQTFKPWWDARFFGEGMDSNSYQYIMNEVYKYTLGINKSAVMFTDIKNFQSGTKWQSFGGDTPTWTPEIFAKLEKIIIDRYNTIRTALFTKLNSAMKRVKGDPFSNPDSGGQDTVTDLDGAVSIVKTLIVGEAEKHAKAVINKWDKLMTTAILNPQLVFLKGILTNVDDTIISHVGSLWTDDMPPVPSGQFSKRKIIIAYMMFYDWTGTNGFLGSSIMLPGHLKQKYPTVGIKTQSEIIAWANS